MTSVQVTFQSEGEVVRQIDVSVSDGVHRVTDGLVLIQLVLPDEVTVLELVTGNLYLTILVNVS